ncbi:H-NS histone family protein [Roseomonas stagni]|uniref:H-NS histone family protein n=1 Tax=Falsiroseomonas algicola TaxID=2716930 RepID=A0A6M1LIN2_9PROT|nr:H-NS histone family protein [Falsiroseomonas algicola]NGM20012.1 H-NS histone family protein [Falsiroseomonas algicola]
MTASEKNSLSSALEALQTLGVAELRQVAAEAERLAQERGESERRSFIEETRKKAAALGLAMSDLLGDMEPASGGRRRGPKPGKKTRASAAVKYRGPNGEPWSGRGRPPRWVQAVEAEGRSRSDFAV